METMYILNQPYKAELSAISLILAFTFELITFELTLDINELFHVFVRVTFETRRFIINTPSSVCVDHEGVMGAFLTQNQRLNVVSYDIFHRQCYKKYYRF